MQLSEELLNFIRAVKPSDHIGLFYDDVEGKRSIVFNYIADGLENSRGVVYVCGEEKPEVIRKGLASLGVDVEPNERSGNLLIKLFNDWYLEKGVADPYRIMNRWNEIAKLFSERGLGARVAGELSNFYHEKRVKELLKYEYALNKTVSFPIEVMSIYNLKSIVETGYTDTIMPIVKALGKAIFASKGKHVLIEPKKVDETEIEKLLELKI
jgi:hypothetical protein